MAAAEYVTAVNEGWGPAGFADVGWAWEQRVPPVAKLVLLAYADGHQTSLERIAECCQITVAEAVQITENLLEAGYLITLVESIERRPRPAPTGLRGRVFERDEFRCQHCGTSDNLSLDHIRPQSKGGGDEMENLQTLCRHCNSRKGAQWAGAPS